MVVPKVKDILSFVSFEIAVIGAALGVGAFLWRLRSNIEEGRKDASAEHEALMTKMTESIEQDRRNANAVVDQIAKMDERNSEAHSRFIDSLARLDERTKVRM